MEKLLIILIGLMGPFVLWPIEVLIGLPYVVEELFKAGAVVFIFGRAIHKTSHLLWVTLFALAFAVSESMLYLFNIFALGTFGDFPQRLLLVGAMHLATTIILFGSYKWKQKWGIFFGLLITISLHYCFNNLVAKF